ncbi:hypothetical protein [Halomonas sp. NCCP-2165]|nr:hypothetical protein [Halomonas sp. NCCP-2165]GKW50171.1 hypothetical protein NCCP2165_23860 [Halomonas sp. NCCP-2165]
MAKRDEIRKELAALYKEGVELAQALQKGEEIQFEYSYQCWYTKALKAVGSLAPDRLQEFRAYYEPDPKRKSLGYGTYVIQDLLKGLAPSRVHYPDFDTKDRALRCFFNQLTIVAALSERIDLIISNIENELYADLQDSELETAERLAKVSPRAAGALVGVVIEGHLQKVAKQHQVKITKKFPTIADLNDPLKAAGIIEVPEWRKISCRVPDDQMSYRSYPLLAARELLQQFIWEQVHGHQAA